MPAPEILAALLIAAGALAAAFDVSKPTMSVHFAKLRDMSHLLGQVASPDDSWLGSRGLRTMSVRLRQHHVAHAGQHGGGARDQRVRAEAGGSVLHLALEPDDASQQHRERDAGDYRRLCFPSVEHGMTSCGAF